MSKFKFIHTKIKDVFIIEPTVFFDERGFFMETYNLNDYKLNDMGMDFVQENHSKSKKGVLRGLHFQIKHPQGKLVRVVKGEVFDVAVDLRKNSDTYGDWVGVFLSENNKKQFYVPEGFAHGFLVLSDEAEFLYKCTDFYHPEDEGGIAYDDEDIAIDWPVGGLNKITLSDKDKKFKKLSEIKVKFDL